jgi:hypothetical protein
MRRVRLSAIAAVILLAIVVFGPIVGSNTAQPASRINLTAAVVEHHTIDVTGYPHGVDYARYKGKLRSDKGPGQPLLAVPFYAVERAVGAESASHFRAFGDLTLWWVTIWSALVPFAALLVLMYRFVTKYAPRYALAATLSIGFGTILLPHAVNLYGHDLAAALGFGAWYVADRPAGMSAWRLASVGALLGAAVAVEYDAAVMFAVIFVALAVRERSRAWLVGFGVLPFAAVVGVYQWRAFGAPWHTPFAYYAGVLNGTSRGGYTLPGVRNLNDVFLGTRGLLLVSPIILLALGAAIWLSRTTSGELRRHAIVALAISAGFIVLSAGWSGTPMLEEPGPRYMIPAFAFLALPLAVAWPRISRIATVAAIWGFVVMTLASFTFLLLVQGDTPVAYFRYAWHHEFQGTVWSVAFGSFGIVVYLLTIVAAGGFVWRALRRPADEQVFVSVPSAG